MDETLPHGTLNGEGGLTMALDLTYNIRQLLFPYDLTPKDVEIRQLDDMDEWYIIRAKEGNCYWLNDVKEPLWIEKVCTPEKGIVEFTIQKKFPQWRFNQGEDDNFMKDVCEYFNQLFNGHSIFGTGFRMKEEHTYDKVDTSYMKYSSEGDELGIVERESDVYIGTTWTLDAPTTEGEEGYTILSEEMKDFILRKLESIFNEKGAYCRENPMEPQTKAFGDLFHYEFIISNF